MSGLFCRPIAFGGNLRHALVFSGLMHSPGISIARLALTGFIGSLTLMVSLAQSPDTAIPPKPPVPPKPGAVTTRTPLPEDLVGDEHVREEFGVNQFTTPSIRKLFEMLDGLGKLSYDTLKRPINRRASSDRVLVSLGFGSLIADGFLIVQCEKVEAMEDVGRALISYAKAIGAGSRMNRHTQSLFEHSIAGDWNKLRTELALTQADVEAEMVQLRDVDIAHLVSLGGWLRALEIASRSVADSYLEEKTHRLMRTDIVDYYTSSLADLNPEIQANPVLKSLQTGLKELVPLMAAPEGKGLTLKQTEVLAEKASVLARIVTDPMRN